jgi:HK97 family phage prohead protease
METKSYPAEIKLRDEGDVEVAFAQLNVVDRDGDITLPGAFPRKAVPISAYGHQSWFGALPVGRGEISEEGDWAIFRGRFFLETEAGREAYATVKAVGELQEWSYGYTILDHFFEQRDGQTVRVLKTLDVHEVSPVLLGAGIGTHTRAIKAVKDAIRPHSTPTDDGTFDADEMRRRLPSERDALRAAHAWVDPDGDPDTKAAYRFIHHLVDEDGSVGAASLVACSTGIGVLNGARGGTTIPDSDRAGVWRHLAGHLRDAGREPPELRSLSPDTGLSLAAAIERFLADGTALGARFRAMQDLRAKEGRVLSAANRERLSSLLAALDEARAALATLLDETDPEKSARAIRLAAAIEAERARALGVRL